MNRYIRRSGSSVWLERSPVTAEVAGSSPVRFVLHEKRHTFTVCLFSCNYAPGLPHPQPRQVTRFPAARMRLESPACHGVDASRRRMELSAPGLPGHLRAGLPLAPARGRGADAGSLHPTHGVQVAICSSLTVFSGQAQKLWNLNFHITMCPHSINTLNR